MRTRVENKGLNCPKMVKVNWNISPDPITNQNWNCISNLESLGSVFASTEALTSIPLAGLNIQFLIGIVLLQLELWVSNRG